MAALGNERAELKCCSPLTGSDPAAHRKRSRCVVGWTSKAKRPQIDPLSWRGTRQRFASAVHTRWRREEEEEERKILYIHISVYVFMQTEGYIYHKEGRTAAYCKFVQQKHFEQGDTQTLCHSRSQLSRPLTSQSPYTTGTGNTHTHTAARCSVTKLNLTEVEPHRERSEVSVFSCFLFLSSFFFLQSSHSVLLLPGVMWHVKYLRHVLLEI